jgi:hypothetical protein
MTTQAAGTHRVGLLIGRCNRLCQPAGDLEFVEHVDDPPITAGSGSKNLRERLKMQSPESGRDLASWSGELCSRHHPRIAPAPRQAFQRKGEIR